MSEADPADQTDTDGNTIFHRAAIQQQLLSDESLAAIAARAATLQVNADHPNRAGRTPLHVLCCYGWYDYLFPVESKRLAHHIRRFLKYVSHVDAPDPRGVRPLHIAAMLSEVLVRELLAAGADPAGATDEGMTPLHLAARARQSNIVGILLDAVRARGPAASAAAVYAPDEAGWQPLHYACRSGRPETVALLLAGPGLHNDGGSTTTATISSLLDACAEFAQEQPLWETYRRPDRADVELIYLFGIDDVWCDDVVGGTGRLDQLRPWVAAGRLIRAAFFKGLASDVVLDARLGWDEEPPSLDEEQKAKDLERERADVEDSINNRYGAVRSDQDTTQLRPILEMLYKAQTRDQAFHVDSLFLQSLRQSIQKLDTSKAGESTESTSTTSDVFYAYTYQCFRDFTSELGQGFQQQYNSQGLLFNGGGSSNNDKELATIEDSEGERNEWGGFRWDGKMIIDRLLRKRKYTPIPRLLLRWATPDPSDVSTDLNDDDDDTSAIVRQEWLAQGLRRLVELGQADVLAAAWANNPGDVVLFSKAEIAGTPEADPLLYLACCRELPNMDVVRLLVETCHVDVNGRSMTIAEREEARTEPEPTAGDDDARYPEPGHATALHELARGRRWWGAALAIPYLIAHGADLTAKNEHGQTPLDVARDHPIHGPYRKEVLELFEVSLSG